MDSEKIFIIKGEYSYNENLSHYRFIKIFATISLQDFYSSSSVDLFLNYIFLLARQRVTQDEIL